MEIEGKIIVNLGETSGTSKAGRAWKKHEYVLETQETYPKKVHFDFFGERADQYPLEVGDMVRLSFDIDSREYNGRWYTGISGWKAEKLNGGMDQPNTTGTQTVPPVSSNQTVVDNFGSADNDDLPF